MIIKYEDFNRYLVDPQWMYIFTDNVLRTSGHNPVEESSWYYKKYGPKDLFYPNQTSSQVRGLDNAYPICIQQYCYANGSYEGGQWKDNNFNLFKQVLDKDILNIKQNLHRYKGIIFPSGGLFNRKTSQITMDRCPKIYMYLMKQLLCLDS